MYIGFHWETVSDELRFTQVCVQVSCALVCFYFCGSTLMCFDLRTILINIPSLYLVQNKQRKRSFITSYFSQ